jgi:hypothetical protein
VLLSRFLAAEGSGDARRRLCTTALALSVALSTVAAEPLSLARQAGAFVPVLLAGRAALAAGVTAGFSAAGAASAALAVLLPAGKHSAMAGAAALEAHMLTSGSGAASLMRLRFAAVVDAALKTSSKSDCRSRNKDERAIRQLYYTQPGSHLCFEAGEHFRADRLQCKAPQTAHQRRIGHRRSGCRR